MIDLVINLSRKVIFLFFLSAFRAKVNGMIRFLSKDAFMHLKLGYLEISTLLQVSSLLSHCSRLVVVVVMILQKKSHVCRYTPTEGKRSYGKR